jgi:regulation of enolase protein 1 (concanavalin A-like superfamily)
MPGHIRIVSLAIGVFAFCFPFGAAEAQSVTGSRARPLVTQNIEEGKLVELHGNTRPEAKAENDRGAVSDDIVLEHMLLQLRRPEEKEEELQEYLEDVQEPGSRHYHQWLSAHEFGERFGPSDRDLDKITDWLEHQHFQVNVVYPSGMVIDFSGTAGQVRKAFHTEIHEIEVKGEKHHANMSNPQIPSAISSLVVGIVSLHDFSPHPMHQMKHQFTAPNPLGGTDFAMAPADLATIYNLNPLFSANNSGQGQTIALIEDTDVFTLADWTSFRSAFGLSGYTAGTISASHPAPPSGTNNCKAPGVVAPNDAEAILDGEWASAAAPSATISMVSCKDTNTTFGGLIAVQNLLNSKTGPPPIMSISYGQCEAVNGAAANAAYNSAYKQAVAEGVSVFVAAGDSGAAGCDNSVSEATSGIAVNAFASTPYNVAVGGTDFSDTYSGTNSSYWNSNNTSTFGSAISYVPEIPWNDSCAGALVSNYENFSPTYGSTSLCNDPNIGPFLQTTVAGGGGPSGCATGTPSIKGVVSGNCKGWPKPSWQSVLGNPHDGVRDTPDVSLFAADGLWGHFYVFCWSDMANGGAACAGDPSNWTGAGGTSFASPIMAGIQALINQRAGARQGNPNPTYYKLAAAEYGSSGNNSCNSSSGASVSSSCVFYDVTLGDMDVNCTGTHNCYMPSGAVGVLSTSNTSFAPAYGTNTGWDFATGIGSVNATNLVNNWPGVAPIQGFLLSATPGSLTLVQGTSGTSTISFAPQGGFSGSVSLAASGLPSGVTASFNPTSTSTTSTLTLSANSTAAAGTANVTIAGTSGTLTGSTTLTLTVNAAPNFALSAAPSRVSLTQGSSGGSTITVTPQNAFTGTVNLSASGMPSGVNAFFSPASTTGSSTLTLAASSTAATGGFTITVTGTSGSLTHTAAVTLTVTAATSALPQGWWDGDVGVVGPAGSASYAGGTFTVNASGQWIWNTADGFNFAYQPLSGDGTIVARLVSMQGGSSSESTGVMIRESLDPSSTHMYAAFSQAAIWAAFRALTGGNTTGQSISNIKLPYWVKLVRSGSNFSAFGSPDGVNWTQNGPTQAITMGQNVFIGLAVCADTNASLATATFDNVSISTAANPAPNISGISPTAGPVGTQVVITGSGFGAPQGGSVVTLNGTLVTVNSWSATSITITIPSGATTGPLVVTVSPSMKNSNPVTFTVNVQTLPPLWSDLDIGTVGPAGSAGYSNGTFTVTASGNWIWNTADSFNFAYQQLSGDGTIVARLVTLQGGSSSESTGVMIRDSLDPASPHMYAAFSQAAIWAAFRSTLGGNTNGQSISSITLPYWVRVVRSGSNFTGYGSPDGVTWTQIGPTQTITMGQNVFVGLAVCADTNSSLATATFDNVSISTVAAPSPIITGISPTWGPVGTQVTVSGSGFGTSQGGSVVNLNGAPVTINTWSDTSISITIPSGGTTGPLVVSIAPSMTNSNPVTFTVTTTALPPQWTDIDVGTVGVAGSASYANGTFTVMASGNWIWNFADSMNFVYQPLSGDGTIIARLLSVQGVNPSQSTGVMIRETLDTASAHAYAAYGGGSMIYFTERPSTGAMSTLQTNNVVVSFPIWVKLSRSGNNFSVFSSPDGTNWTQIGVAQSIPMAQNVFIGLAVCSDNNSALATATFDNVSIQ